VFTIYKFMIDRELEREVTTARPAMTLVCKMNCNFLIKVLLVEGQ
jgi:hypothetical protein